MVSFTILGWISTRINAEKPPIPKRVVTTTGIVPIDEGGIERGQNVWQSMGGMEVGSIWGHGSYVAPDCSEDWLHREATFILSQWSHADFRTDYAQLNREQQAQLQGRRANLMRTNTYDPTTKTITQAPIRGEAFQVNSEYYRDVFANGRTEYAIPKGAVTNHERLRHLCDFYFWTSWAASTNRPHDTLSHTNNWPDEPLVGNRPTVKPWFGREPVS